MMGKKPEIMFSEWFVYFIVLFCLTKTGVYSYVNFVIVSNAGFDNVNELQSLYECAFLMICNRNINALFLKLSYTCGYCRCNTVVTLDARH